MKKNIIVTTLLLIIVLGLGGYALFTMTDVGNTVKNIVTKNPDKKTVETYFPSDKVIELGKIDTTLSDETYYGFITEKMGMQELLLLPSSFNNQDINKRSYFKIKKGEFIPEENSDMARLSITDKFNNEGQNVSVLYKHKVIKVTEGIEEEIFFDFFKVEFIEGDEKTKEVWIYQDEDNVFKYKGDNEEIRYF